MNVPAVLLIVAACLASTIVGLLLGIMVIRSATSDIVDSTPVVQVHP